MIYFTSDLHFGHDKEFIWGERGFQSLKDMENSIVERWNSMVSDEDTVYVLGDIYMGDDKGNNAIQLLLSLKGNIIILGGNHDSQQKVDKLESYGFKIEYPAHFTYKDEKKHKWQFYLSHYPTITATLESDPYKCVINLHGHTHFKSKFFEDKPFMYNVGMDAHNCTPVPVEEIIEDYIAAIEDCYKYLKDE